MTLGELRGRLRGKEDAPMRWKKDRGLQFVSVVQRVDGKQIDGVTTSDEDAVEFFRDLADDCPLRRDMLTEAEERIAAKKEH